MPSPALLAAMEGLMSKGIKITTADKLGDIEYITTGIKEIDEVVKLPIKRVTEIYGLQSVGKTTFALFAIAGMQKQGLKILFIDVENSINLEWANGLGVDLKKLHVATPVYVEEVSDIVIDNVANYDCIIVDSVAAMVPLKEQEGQPGDAHVGLKARLMGQFMRRLTGPLSQSKCAVVFINQLRENIDLFSAPYSTPGGMALRYQASLRLELKTTSKDRVMSGGERSGHWVTATVTKSKVGKPHQTARFKLSYENKEE